MSFSSEFNVKMCKKCFSCSLICSCVFALFATNEMRSHQGCCLALSLVITVLSPISFVTPTLLMS